MILPGVKYSPYHNNNDNNNNNNDNNDNRFISEVINNRANEYKLCQAEYKCPQLLVL